MRRKKHYFTRGAGRPAPLELTVERTLRFSEVDALAIAWHGHYLRFFEEVHTELMRKIGLSYERYFAAHLGAPVAQAHVDYHAPLLLDRPFTVTARLFWNDGARLDVEYEIRTAEGTLAATGYTVQMFVELATRQPCLTPPPLLAECQEHWLAGDFADLAAADNA